MIERANAQPVKIILADNRMLCDSLLRMMITVAVRAFFIVRMRGMGIWIFAAVYGTAYQILMSPLMAANSWGGRRATRWRHRWSWRPPRVSRPLQLTPSLRGKRWRLPPRVEATGAPGLGQGKHCWAKSLKSQGRLLSKGGKGEHIKSKRKIISLLYFS